MGKHTDYVFRAFVRQDRQGYRAGLALLHKGKQMFKIYSPIVRAFLEDAEMDAQQECNRLEENQNPVFRALRSC